MTNASFQLHEIALIIVLSLPRSTPPRIYNPGHYYEDPIVMSVSVEGSIGEPPMPRPASTQPYGRGCFNNMLNENNQHFDMDDTPSPSTLHQLSGAIPSSVNQSIPQPEDFSAMATMSNMSTVPTSTLTPDWGMGSAPFMASMPAVAPMAGMPAGWTTGPQPPITMGPPPVPVATRPNMRKRIPAAATVTSESPSVVDEHHLKPEGAYYPPTKRIKREHTHTHTPRKPSWAASSVTDDASVVSLPRPPQENVNPPPPAGQTGRKSFPTTFTSHSSVPAATQQPPVVQRPSSPIIPTPLEPFPEAGTIMNFPLPQIDHQGQRPASGEGYFSALEDDLLYQMREPYEIEMAYRAALRVRERVDWDCRRLGLRLRYLRRCQARAAELNRVARRCEWQRDDFGEHAGSGR